MEHHFNIELAKEYGILEAILIQNIYYWTLKNKANNKHYHNGYYWSYNSIKAFSELFPYVSQRQIQYSLKKLKDLGIIMTDNFNTSPYDKTLWYSISNKGLSIIQNCQMEIQNLSNGSVENVEPIPNINTYINTNINNNTSKNDNAKQMLSNNFDDEFDQLWKKYPNKQGRKDALRHFINARKKSVSFEKINDGIDGYIDYVKKNGIAKQYIMHGSTWFCGEHWNDEYEINIEADDDIYTRIEDLIDR